MSLLQSPPDLAPSVPTPRTKLSAGATSWSFFESGRTSYSVLIGIYVFVPYLAAVMVKDPVKGQSLVADLGKWAGVAAALTAPLLGSAIDHLGRRKPPLLVLNLLAAPLVACLWFALPGGGGLSATSAAWIIAAMGVLLTLSEVLHNSMLVYGASPSERAHASGLGMAFGNGVSCALMILVLWALMLPGTIDSVWVPAKPLFGLQTTAHEPERAVAPLVAVALLVSMIPMMLFTRDAPRSGIPFFKALLMGLRDLRHLVGLLRDAPQARKYLLARLIFADAQGGIIMFTGVFAAGVLGWGPTELMIEGLLASVFAVLGGLLAAQLDSRIGAKRSLFLTLGGSVLAVLGEIGVAKDRLFFLWPYDPMINGRPWNGPLFNTWPDVAFIICDLGVSVFMVSAFASSRTLMAELAPPERSAAFFGLYALSGRATAWLCPMLVGAATLAFKSQQLGFIPIAALMLLGMILLTRVRTARP